MAWHLDAFFDLNRTFSKIPFDADATDDVDLSGRQSRNGKLHWLDLLQQHRVILLSEAGSGKTAEIRNVIRQLRSGGIKAFFLRIENVCPHLEDAFEEGSFDEYQSWLDSGTEGWLFMDSVDEARLKDPRDFERAIRKLGRSIQRIGAQAHILITGRSSAWRARTDLALCNEVFSFEPITKQEPSVAIVKPDESAQLALNETTIDTSFLVVTLDDIHGEQIDRFLKATGVDDTKAFSAELERRDAWSLTTRPLDFLELVEFWHVHHRIGTRLELMQSSINRRLEEHDQNRAEIKPISPERLREGVRLIAAATTLGQISAICVPDGNANKKGIPIREILRDWDDSKTGALLSRPIFEPGLYGTVRFHHRTVREYLTAEWLHGLIRNAASRVKIEKLFFRTQYGLQVINPSMRPVLPWLALLDKRICSRLEEIAPEVFFEGGDPGQLQLSTRRNVLHKACAHLAQPAHSWTITDYSAVQRFAHADLTEDIKELLSLYQNHDDVCWFLLRMVWQGEVVGAIEEAKRFALTSQHKHTRLAAIRAVTDLGTSQDVAEVRHALTTDSVVNRYWLAELIDGMQLDQESLAWLLDIIERAAEKERFSGTDNLEFNFLSLVSDLSLEFLPALIRRVALLLDKPPMKDEGFNPISKKYYWLAAAAGVSVLRLLQARDRFPIEEATLAILSKLGQAHNYNDWDIRDLGEKLRAIVGSWPELDFRLFWYDVAVARRGRVHRGEPVIHVWQLLGFRPFWSLNRDNFSLICDQISSLADHQDRHMALSMAFETYAEHGKPAIWESQLYKATESYPELQEKLELLLHPPARQIEEWEVKQAQWKEKMAQREANKIERRRAWHEKLTANVSLINSSEPGVITPAQVYLLDLLNQERDSTNTWGGSNWRSLIPEFGMPLAQAFRDGAINFWRGYCPTLPSEGADPNSIPYELILGLTGLAIEATEEVAGFLKLPITDVERAARYGVLELNGFPQWLPKLLERYPECIQEVFWGEIEYELDSSHSDMRGNHILRRLRWGGDWLYEAISPSMLERLSQPVNSLESLQIMLSVVAESSISDEALADLASNRALAEVDPEFAPVWFATWIGAEPAVGITAFARCLESLFSDEEKSQFAMRCLIALSGSHNARRCRQNYKAVEHAKELYLLTNKYIRITDDIKRAGTGVYTPGLRDDAQAARDGLLAFIRETPGKEAFLALEEIARAHPAECVRPWSAFYAKQKATADSQTPPWEPAKVIEFYEALENTPSTHRELWVLAVDRLYDLKIDLEDGDSSIAEILLLAKQETAIRKFIGNWCRERANGRYVIPQEEQLADDKRPDFRIHGCAFDGPVPTELKLADNWTGSQLFERLENQLGGDYLRDVRSTCGVFLLVNQGGKKSWKITGKAKRVDFDGLVTELQQHWHTLAPNFPNVDDIEVIGIDLTKRGGSGRTGGIKKQDKSKEK